jgi:(1->4)-alpha-D-glucan 1-alpha-D-glucosylmutase
VERHSERPAAFIEEAQLARQQILNGSLASDFESVAQALLQVARDDLMTRDLTLGAIRRALQELIVHFPVYRTYISALGRSAPTTRFSSRPWTAPATLSEGDWPVLDTWKNGSAASRGGNRPRAARARSSSMPACASSN